MRPSVLIAGMAIFLAGGPACAAPAPIPQSVAAHIKDMNQTCRQVGGTPMAPGSGFLVSADLNGDGIVDWAIDEGSFNCKGAASLFSGSGGSQIYVFVGTPGARARESFVHGAYGMKLEHGSGRDTLWLTVGSPLCGQSGEPSHAEAIECERPLAWNKATRKFGFAPLSMARMLGGPKLP